MADTEVATAAAPAMKRRRRNADTRVLVAGTVALCECVLSQLFNPAKVDAAMKKARKLPAVKAMLGLQKTGGSSSGPCLLRSAYNAFMQDFLYKMKTGGNEITLLQAAGIWSILPEDRKKELHGRYSGIMQAYNAKVSAGAPVKLSDVISMYEETNRLQPLDHVQLWRDFKEAAAAAAEAKAALQGRHSKQEAPSTPTAEAAAANVAAVATTPGDIVPEDSKVRRKHSSRKDKRRKSKDRDVGKRSHDKKTKKKKKKKLEVADDV